MNYKAQQLLTLTLLLYGCMGVWTSNIFEKPLPQEPQKRWGIVHSGTTTLRMIYETNQGG